MTAELSGEELQLYERLLDTSPVDVGELAADADQAATLAALSALEARGFVVRLPGDPPRVEARHPQEAFADVLARQRDHARALDALVAGLTSRYTRSRRTSISLELLEVISDPAEVLRQYDQLQHLATREFRACDRPPYVSDPDARDTPMLQRLSAGVRYRVLSDPRSREVRRSVTTRQWAEAGVQSREMTDLPLKLLIADDVRALLVLDSRDGQITSSLVVHPSALLQGLIAVFESLWKLALPRDPPRTRAAGNEPGASVHDAELLSLLATGLTEDMIARRLDISSRTAQRRIQNLMERLGATNRFQAGLWAARRGWL